MSLDASLKYTAEHEWVAVDGDVARIGITSYAADKLGDVVFVDLPKVGQAVVADPSLVNSDPFGAGWMIAVRFTELPALLTADEYAALTAE